MSEQRTPQQTLDQLGHLHEWAAAVDAAAEALTKRLAGSGDWSKATPELASAALTASGLPAKVERLRAKLDEMELHDDLPDSFDMGYMAAWREINDALRAA